jgi:energy-coupling factor transport system substrate-specific component
MKKSYIFLVIMLVIAVFTFVVPVLDSPLLNSLFNWGVMATVLVILTCVAFLLDFEAAAVSSKEIALVTMLGTVSAVLRVPFAAIPNVQPCTYLIICSGYVFGPVAGFAVGAITAIVSNFFLGQGPWTLYQMIAWGLTGVSAGYLGKFNVNRAWLVAFGVAWGYFYGWITNIWFWTAFVYPLTINTFIITQINTVWFDTLHAIGNAIFLGILGMKTIAILQRFERRFTVEYSSR